MGPGLVDSETESSFLNWNIPGYFCSLDVIFDVPKETEAVVEELSKRWVVCCRQW